MEEIYINVFIAYSRENSDLRLRLDKHLSGLKRRKYINTWFDGLIEPGSEWEKEIDSELSRADIILLLISADFIASDYCFDVEMKKAISRHEKGDAVIIPIILHPCDWSELPFSKIQGLPQNGKAVSSDYWTSSEVAFSEIAKSIKSIVDNLRKSKKKHLIAINEVLDEKENELRITLDQIEELRVEEEILRETIENLKIESQLALFEIEEIKEKLKHIKVEYSNSEKTIQKLKSKERNKYDLLKKKADRAEKIMKKYDHMEDEIRKQSSKLGSLTKQVNQKRIELDDLNSR